MGEEMTEERTETENGTRTKIKFRDVMQIVFERLAKYDGMVAPTMDVLGGIIKEFELADSYVQRPYAIISKMKSEPFTYEGQELHIVSLKIHPKTQEQVTSYEKGWIALIPKSDCPIPTSSTPSIPAEKTKTEEQTKETHTPSPPVSPQNVQHNISADLSVDEKRKLLTPTKAEDAAYIHRKIENITDIDILKKAFETHKNVLLVGPAGCGKTSSARHFAYENKLPYASVELHGGVEIGDLIGQWTPTDEAGKFKWVDGLLTFMVRYGGVFVAEEVNYMPSDFSSKLHGLLDKQRRLVLTEKDGEIIYAHPQFCFIACMNYGAEGTHMLTEAFKDRFDVELSLDYDEKIERQLIKDEKLLQMANKLRTMYYNNKEVSTIVSTRMLLQFEDNAKEFGRNVAERIFFDKFDSDERGKVKESFEMMTKTDSGIGLESNVSDTDTDTTLQDLFG